MLMVEGDFEHFMERTFHKMHDLARVLVCCYCTRFAGRTLHSRPLQSIYHKSTRDTTSTEQNRMPMCYRRRKELCYSLINARSPPPILDIRIIN